MRVDLTIMDRWNAIIKQILLLQPVPTNELADFPKSLELDAII